MKKKVPTYLHWPYYKNKGFPGSSAGKQSACKAGHRGSIPGSGSSGDGLPTPVFLGFPSGSGGKESAAMQETWVWSLAWEDH